MKIYYITILFLFITGCSSLPTSELHSRKPADNQTQIISRNYQDSVRCQSTSEESSETIKLSALSGYMVGPTPALYASNPEAPTLRPFFSDGCSSSPDALPFTKKSENWIDCCIQHDTAYWLGGTIEDKKNADNILEKCIAGKGSPKIGKIYRAFVRKFGGPNSQNNYRWGYGWNYKRGFAPISAAESELISAMYGTQKEEIGQTLFNNNFPLIRTCNSQDPVFQGFTAEEKLIYSLLNSSLKNDDLIEWAKWGYFNLAHREFEVKLRSCPSPIIFRFKKENNSAPEINNPCN